MMRPRSNARRARTTVQRRPQDQHLERFAERVLSGGDVIIWTATKNLWVVHHEGFFAQMRSNHG